MKKNVILAAALGIASGFFAGLATTELLKQRSEKQSKKALEALPAPQIVVELPPEQENENSPGDGIEKEPVTQEIVPEEAPVAVQKGNTEDEEDEAESDGGKGADLCYYLPQSKIWHSNDTCAYIVGKEGIVTSTVAKARAAGKKRACDRCGA